MIAESSTRPAPMPRSRRASRFAALAGAAALAIGVLAGCGTGQITETANQHPTTGGSNADVGKIALRNMHIEAPTDGSWAAGDDVALTMTIVNNSQAGDQLVSITTDAAQQVMIFANSAEYLSYLGTKSPSASATAESSASPTSSASATPTTSGTASNPGVTAPATPTTAGATETPTGSSGNPGSGTPEPNGNQTNNDSSGSASPSVSSGPSPSPASVAPSGAIVLPHNEAVRFGYSQEDRPVILLVGLTASLGGGQSANLTFTFANAGSGTAAVAVDLSEGGAESAPTIDLHHEGGHGGDDTDNK